MGRPFLLLLLLLTTSLLRAETERPISDPIPGLGYGIQSRSAVASDGENYYVVWSNSRDLMLTRFRRDGSRIDAVPKRLADSVEYDEPAIIWNGTDFLVLWYGRASRMSRGGELHNPAGYPVHIGISHRTIAWNGRNYLASGYTGTSVSVSLLDDQGRELKRRSFGFGVPIYPRIASDGENFLVVHREDSGIFATLLSGAAEILAGPGVVAEFGGYPEVAFAGDAYLVAFGVGKDLRVARVSRTGVLIGPTEAIATVSTGGVALTAIQQDESGVLVIVQEEIWLGGLPSAGPASHLHAIRLSNSGARRGSLKRIIDSPLANSVPSLAWNGTNLFMSWIDAETLYRDNAIRGSLLAADGAVLQYSGNIPGVPVSVEADSQWNPKVYWNGSTYLALWSEYFRDIRVEKLMAGRFDRDLNSLDGPGVAIARGDGRDTFAFDAAWDGERYLLAWTQFTEERPMELYATFVSADERPAVQETILLARGGYTLFPTVAFNGTVFLVKWPQRCVRITPGGVVLDVPPLTTLEWSPNNEVRLATDGRDFLVVFAAIGTPGCNTCSGTFAYRITTDAAAGPIYRVLNTYGDGLAVASAGDGYMLAYTRLRDLPRGKTDTDVHIVRVQSDGRPLDAHPGIRVSPSPTSEGVIGIIPRGHEYLAVWAKFEPFGDATNVLEAAEVRSDGSSRIIGRDVISNADSYAMHLAEAPPDRTAALSFTRPAIGPRFFGEGRAFVRFLEPAAPRKRGARR